MNNKEKKAGEQIKCPHCKLIGKNIAVFRNTTIDNVSIADCGYKCEFCGKTHGFEYHGDEQMDEFRKYPLMLNPFESGMLLSKLLKSKDKQQLMPVIEQLKAHVVQMREESGVVTTELGDGLVSMVDKDGTQIIRAKYPFEDESDE